MTWQNEIVRIVRFLINDIDASTYTDDRLEETILVAAQLMLVNVDFSTDYTIDVDELILSPDPTIGTKDNDFIALVSLKAACIVLGSECKTAAAQGWRIKDASSSIDTTASYQSLYQLLKGLSGELDSLIMGYQAGNSIGAGAVMTPYTYNALNGIPMRNFE